MKKVVGCTKIELECQVPVFGQFGLCRLDICGLNVTLRSRPKRFATAEPLDPFLHSFSCLAVDERTAAGLIKVAAQA